MTDAPVSSLLKVIGHGPFIPIKGPAMSDTKTVSRSTIQARVVQALEEFGADPDAITPDATFESLDVDSLDLVELGQIVQEEYGVEIKGEDMPNMKTVGSAVDLIAERAGA
jgi:acyl carrier protein